MTPISIEREELGIAQPSTVEAWHRRSAKYSASIAMHEWVVVPSPARVAFVVEAEPRHVTDDAGETFKECAQTWRRDTATTSSLSEIVMHPAYQRIIGLGPRAIPLILRDLAHQTDHWSWALRAIVGRDVAEGTSTLDEASAAWLKWGRQNNLA